MFLNYDGTMVFGISNDDDEAVKSSSSSSLCIASNSSTSWSKLFAPAHPSTLLWKPHILHRVFSTSVKMYWLWFPPPVFFHFPFYCGTFFSLRWFPIRPAFFGLLCCSFNSDHSNSGYVLMTLHEFYKNLTLLGVLMLTPRKTKCIHTFCFTNYFINKHANIFCK